jgi:hypothetical protein
MPRLIPDEAARKSFGKVQLRKTKERPVVSAKKPAVHSCETDAKE